MLDVDDFMTLADRDYDICLGIVTKLIDYFVTNVLIIS